MCRGFNSLPDHREDCDVSGIDHLTHRSATVRRVAQPGSALRSGRRGRRFESCHADHGESRKALPFFVFRTPHVDSHSMIRPQKPARLRKGDIVGVIAPSSPQRDDARLRAGIDYIRGKGYNVVEGEHLWNRHGYLAGHDEERLHDLNGFLRDPDVRMIVAGRGGYGATRILSGIDYRAARRDPKIVVGFSDVTAINLALLRRANLVTFSGAMPGVDFWDPALDPLTESSFWNSVTSVRTPGRSHPAHKISVTPASPGRARGPIVPANLTLLCSLLGTKFLPALNGAILVIEEIGEEPYRVDRMLSQLLNAGVLRNVAGIVLGAFTGTEPKRVSVDSLPLEEVFNHFLQIAGKPAVSGLPYGHIRSKLTLPVGIMTEIDGGRGTIRLLESGVA